MAQDGLTIGGSAYVCKKKTIVRGVVEMGLAYVISVIRQVVPISDPYGLGLSA